MADGELTMLDDPVLTDKKSKKPAVLAEKNMASTKKIAIKT